METTAVTPVTASAHTPRKRRVVGFRVSVIRALLIDTCDPDLPSFRFVLPRASVTCSRCFRMEVVWVLGLFRILRQGPTHCGEGFSSVVRELGLLSNLYRGDRGLGSIVPGLGLGSLVDLSTISVDATPSLHRWFCCGSLALLLWDLFFPFFVIYVRVSGT